MKLTRLQESLLVLAIGLLLLYLSKVLESHRNAHPCLDCLWPPLFAIGLSLTIFAPVVPELWNKKRK